MRTILNFILFIVILLAFGLGLLFLYAGLDGPTGIQEAAGGALASVTWIFMVFAYMLRRDYLSG
jgi:hypothetical protein